MPRTGPRRPLVALKLGDEWIAVIDRLGEQEGVNRSEMIRRLLGEAIAARQITIPHAA
jgi:metal-responsive CopG/Arc/MetJ family transcriptional regulator